MVLVKVTHWKCCLFVKAETCISRTREVGCQTESPKLHSVGTQLSRRTLQSHYRSTGLSMCLIRFLSCIHLLQWIYSWHGVKQWKKTPNTSFITGVQTTVSSQTPGTSSFTAAAIATVMSPKPFKTPSKRPRMELEEDDVFIAGCSSVVTADRSDGTYDPADTSLTEPIDIS